MGLPVVVEQGLGDVGPEVLELHQSVWPTVLDGLHELVYDLKVLPPLDALVLQAEVELIVEELLVVSADVDGHR